MGGIGGRFAQFHHQVNAVKQRHKIFQEDCPTSVLPYHNANILLLWKASNKTSEEALLILNKDPWNHQSFQVDNLSTLVQAGAPCATCPRSIRWITFRPSRFPTICAQVRV
ncbi:MAG: hypothetical protein R3F37_09360 [Candidatus Competibacteraceae bacterium]